MWEGDVREAEAGDVREAEAVDVREAEAGGVRDRDPSREPAFSMEIY
jgi:hypothetical protein